MVCDLHYTPAVWPSYPYITWNINTKFLFNFLCLLPDCSGLGLQGSLLSGNTALDFVTTDKTGLSLNTSPSGLAYFRYNSTVAGYNNRREPNHIQIWFTAKWNWLVCSKQ